MYHSLVRARERLFSSREIAPDTVSSRSATLLYPGTRPTQSGGAALPPVQAGPSDPPAPAPAWPVAAAAVTLVTHEGGLLSFDPGSGTLVQRSLAESTDPTLCWRVEGGRVELLDPASNRLLLEAQQVSDGADCFGLQLAGGSYLCASPHLGPVSTASAELLAWERLIALSAEDMALLRGLSARRWLIDDDDRPTSRDAATIEPGFKLRFGGRDCSIKPLLAALRNDHAPRHPSGLPMSFVFFHDTCTPARAFLFEPLIYSTVCGPDHFFEQHALAVQSIERFGCYDGSYLLLSDRDEAAAAAVFANMDASRWICLKQDLSTADQLVSARRQALRLDSFKAYQPILYIDTDVICDASIEPLLTTAIRGERLLISAEYGGRSIAQVGLPHSNWFGGFLYQPGDTRILVERCINSGIFAGRDRGMLDDALSLVGRAWECYRQAHGEAHRAAFDQPFFSYVLQRLDLADVESMRRWVTILNGNEPGEEHSPGGLVHFNAGVGQNKTEAMGRYLKRLRRIVAPEMAAPDRPDGTGDGRHEEVA